MMYISTRGYDKKFSAAEAIKQGIAPDGGLFVPEEIFYRRRIAYRRQVKPRRV